MHHKYTKIICNALFNYRINQHKMISLNLFLVQILHFIKVPLYTFFSNKIKFDYLLENKFYKSRLPLLHYVLSRRPLFTRI